MNTPLLIFLSGGGFYFGGPVIGGVGVVLMLLVCLGINLTEGFRSRK